MISIRALNVGLVVVCIVVVATLCTSLAVWSGDNALADTERSRDLSVKAAFDVGMETADKVVEDYLNQQATSVVDRFEAFFQVFIDATDSLCHRVMSQPAVISDWNQIYSYRREFYHLVKTVDNYDGIGMVSTSFQTVQAYESEHTLGKQGGYHHFMANINNGSADKPGGEVVARRTFTGDIIPDGSGDTYGWPEHATEAHKYPDQCSNNGTLAAATDGKQLDIPCRFPGYNLNEIHLQLLNYQPVGVTLFTPLISMLRYVGVLSQCVYANVLTGERLGLVYVAADMRKITLKLAAMDLGKGSLGRVFAMVRKNWVSPSGDQVGYIAATSHGSAMEPFYPERWPELLHNRPMSISKCSDQIVRAAGMHLLSSVEVNGTNTTVAEVESAKGLPYFLTLPTNRSEGEGFYARVTVLDNGRGLNWYIVALVDREYILGKVDRQNEATQADIRASESKVDEDLADARLLLYLVAVTVALIPIGLTVFLVFRITKPLIQLMKDMSHVAIMDLDSVDAARPLSSLTEVCEMEKSFKQMIKNLIEYRQYLPQSVLVDSVTEDETDQDQTLNSTVVKDYRSAASASSLSTRSRHGASMNAVLGTAVKPKMVTIAVANIKGLHSFDQAKIPHTIAAYCEALVKAAKVSRGIVDDVCGDKATVCFNTVVACASHRLHAAEYAMHIRADASVASIPTNLALGSGTATCGTVGCIGLKKFGVIGPVATDVRSLERCGSAWGVAVLADGDVAKSVESCYILRSLLKAMRTGGRATLLVEIMSARKTENEEWMYQLENAAAQDPYRHHNAAILLMYDHKLDEAAETAKSHTSDSDTRVRDMIDRARLNGHPPDPIPLRHVRDIDSV